jgi:hypothetical protein
MVCFRNLDLVLNFQRQKNAEKLMSKLKNKLACCQCMKNKLACCQCSLFPLFVVTVYFSMVRLSRRRLLFEFLTVCLSSIGISGITLTWWKRWKVLCLTLESTQWNWTIRGRKWRTAGASCWEREKGKGKIKYSFKKSLGKTFLGKVIIIVKVGMD